MSAPPGPEAAAAMMDKASRHLARHDGGLALGTLDAAAARDPALALEPGWWRRRAWALAALDDLGAAIEAIDRGLAIDPVDGASLQARAALLGWRGDVAEAEQAVRAALLVEPDDAGALAVYAEILSRGGEHHAARVVAERALTLDPHAPDVLVTRMYVAHAAGEADAGRLVERALAVDPANPLALHMRSHQMLAAGRFEEARTAADAAARETPGAEDLTSHARTLRHLDHWSAAPIRPLYAGGRRAGGVWVLTFLVGSVLVLSPLGGFVAVALMYGYARTWPRVLDRLRRRR